MELANSNAGRRRVAMAKRRPGRNICALLRKERAGESGRQG
jgi:hypothetical protein